MAPSRPSPAGAAIGFPSGWLGKLAVTGVLGVALAALWRARAPTLPQQEQQERRLTDDQGVLSALAAWVPPPPRTMLGRVVAYAWAAPLSLPGLLAGALSRTRPTVRDGVLLFAGARGVPAAVLRRRGFRASTWGHVVLALDQPQGRLWAHELVHVRQAERLGPLMAPLYVGLLAIFGYARHPMEQAARRAQVPLSGEGG